MSGPRFDVIVGIDVSSLSSVTQEQLVQMVNESAPLSDIGFCLFGTTTPDVANNPRFARYIWLDTSSVPPTPKFYNSDNGMWEVGSTDLTDLSIVAIQDFIDTYGVYIQNVHVKADFTADAAQGYFIARAKSNGKDCELVDLPTALTDAGNVPIANIQTNTAGDKTFLVTDVVAGVKTASWRTFAPATDISNGQLPLAKLAAGTNGYILQMGEVVPSWVDPGGVTTQGGGGATNRVKDLITAKDGGQVDGNSAPFHQATAGMVVQAGPDIFAGSQITPRWVFPPFVQHNTFVNSGVTAKLETPPYAGQWRFNQLSPPNNTAITLQLDGGTIANANGKNAIFNAFIECLATDDVFAIGDCIPFDQVFESASGTDFRQPVLSFVYNRANGTCKLMVAVSVAYHVFYAGVIKTLTPSKWTYCIVIAY